MCRWARRSGDAGGGNKEGTAGQVGVATTGDANEGQQ